MSFTILVPVSVLANEDVNTSKSLSPFHCMWMNSIVALFMYLYAISLWPKNEFHRWYWIMILHLNYYLLKVETENSTNHIFFIAPFVHSFSFLSLSSVCLCLNKRTYILSLYKPISTYIGEKEGGKSGRNETKSASTGKKRHGSVLYS